MQQVTHRFTGKTGIAVTISAKAADQEEPVHCGRTDIPIKAREGDVLVIYPGFTFKGEIIEPPVLWLYTPYLFSINFR